MKVLDKTWCNDMIEAIRCHKVAPALNINEVLSSDQPTKWLVTQLAARNISFKVINLGAGVRRVTTETSTCPKCNGTGRC